MKKKKIKEKVIEWKIIKGSYNKNDAVVEFENIVICRTFVLALTCLILYTTIYIALYLLLLATHCCKSLSYYFNFFFCCCTSTIMSKNV